jgi:ankyrin repeat protein
MFKYQTRAKGTPLHYAALSGLHDVVNYLIVERSQNVNARGPIADETPLAAASRRGYSEVSRVLLEHGADPEIRDRYGKSPLDRASQNGHLDVLLVLLEHHAYVNPSVRATALHLASSFGNAAIVRVLLANGADANDKAWDDKTPLHSATNHEVTRVLLEYGADPNARDFGNKTPLHRAMIPVDQSDKVAQVLLENGADANARDDRNQTPLHVASERGYLNGVRLLLQHSADIHVLDDEGLTPFQLA